MKNNKTSALLAVLVTTGFVFTVTAQASPEPTLLGHRTGVAGGIELASNYDPYTHAMGPCAQGAPYGGPGCRKVIPKSNPYPLG